MCADFGRGELSGGGGCAEGGEEAVRVGLRWSGCEREKLAVLREELSPRTPLRRRCEVLRTRGIDPRSAIGCCRLCHAAPVGV